MLKIDSYTYDVWGNFSTTYHNGANYSSPAALSNIRYRGYYYDSDLAFYYQKNEEFNILNAPTYGKYLKENCYQDSNRTAQGLTVELQAHYILYKMRNSHGLNGSNMGEASWDKDCNAIFFELPFEIRYIIAI
jgi:hypothetical protein